MGSLVASTRCSMSNSRVTLTLLTFAARRKHGKRIPGCSCDLQLDRGGVVSTKSAKQHRKIGICNTFVLCVKLGWCHHWVNPLQRNNGA